LTKKTLKITEKKRLSNRNLQQLGVFRTKIQAIDLNIDYTGNVYSPMQLPLLSALDPRAPESFGTVCKTFNSRILVCNTLNSMPELKPIELLPKQNNSF
jgi:outer membrane receptor for ferrienterochelin and colicins